MESGSIVRQRAPSCLIRLMIFVVFLLLTVPLLLTPHASAADSPFGPFNRTWGRTDRPVADGAVSRTWMWGPEPITDLMGEEYAERSPVLRGVQYFDKSRMENNSWHKVEAPWDVTNGLLVVEMVDGRIQTGDSQFVDSVPADINIAGDSGEHPTYADIASFGLRDEPATAVGSTLTSWFGASGVQAEARTPPTVVTAAERLNVSVIDHTVASVFWEFMNSTGLVEQDGRFVQAPLFINPYYATGFPITEAYWSEVKIGGAATTVLWQCFERRCLTYNPSNPAGWQVEAGNVGRHYYLWRYNEEPQKGSQSVPLLDVPVPNWYISSSNTAKWFVANDAYHVTVGPNLDGYWAGAYSGYFADVEVSIDVRLVDGIGWGCVVARGNYAFGKGAGYNLCIDQDGEVGAYYVGFDDVVTFIELLPMQHTSFAYPASNWNTLSIRAQGSSLEFFVNGGAVGSVQNDARRSGAIGVNIGATSNSSVEFEFRNALVRSAAS